MAVSSFARAIPSFECRSDPDFSRPEIPSGGGFSGKANRGGAGVHGLSSLIMKFPPNFVRQLSNKARRNCSNIGVAQVVAASWSNNQGGSGTPSVAKAIDSAAAAAAIAPVEVETGVEDVVPAANDPRCNGDVQIDGSTNFNHASFLNSDGSIAIHAGMIIGIVIIFLLFIRISFFMSYLNCMPYAILILYVEAVVA